MTTDLAALQDLQQKLTMKIAAAQETLAGTKAEVTEHALAYESGDQKQLRPLAAAEKKAAGIAEEIARLSGAHEAVAQRISDAKAGREEERVHEMAAEYVVARDAHHNANLDLAERMATLIPLGRTANEAGRQATKLGLQLGLPVNRDGSAYGPAIGFLRAIFEDSATRGVYAATSKPSGNSQRALEALRKPWRHPGGILDERLKALGL
jgi:hypothetical protein